MLKYSLEDVSRIKENGFSFSIPEQTLALIKNIARLVGSPDYIKTPIFQKRKRTVVDTEPDWELLKQFKPTAKAVHSDNEQLIQLIKGALNKMTDKNYTKMCKAVFENLDKLEDTTEYDLVNDIIFNIVSSNRFFSKIYATFYKELLEHSTASYFKERLQVEVTNYIDRFSTIRCVNPNEDYDGFCDLNKENERRKALTEFFMDLMIMEVISVEEVIDIYKQLYLLVEKNVSDMEQKHTIVELSENIYIFMDKGAKLFNGKGEYKAMYDNIKGITKMKVKEYPGLSNKSLFKFMDIMDI
jgi:hypothetical protein